MSTNSKYAILWCREGEDFGILVFLDFNGKYWEETRISADVSRFTFFTPNEAKRIAYARNLQILNIGEQAQID